MNFQSEQEEQELEPVRGKEREGGRKRGRCEMDAWSE